MTRLPSRRPVTRPRWRRTRSWCETADGSSCTSSARSVTEHWDCRSRARMRTLLGVASACIVSATSSARSPSIAASGSRLSCLKWATDKTYLKRYSDCPGPLRPPTMPATTTPSLQRSAQPRIAGACGTETHSPADAFAVLDGAFVGQQLLRLPLEQLVGQPLKLLA